MDGPVSERERHFAHSQGRKNRAVGDGAQRQDYAQVRQSLDRIGQKRTASGNFRADGFVLGRDAANGIGDLTADQFKAVIGSGIVVSPGQTKFAEGCVQQIARVIAGKGTARPVGTAQAGR